MQLRAYIKHIKTFLNYKILKVSKTLMQNGSKNFIINKYNWNTDEGVRGFKNPQYFENWTKLKRKGWLDYEIVY